MKAEKLLILGALLSISNLCCSKAISSECRPELLENVDFPGTDIKFVYSPDAEHCQQLCTQHPACLFFTFVRHDWVIDDRHFHCYLKVTPSGDPNVQKAILGATSGFSLKNCNQISVPESCWSKLYKDTDFNGADYTFLFTADAEECQRVCSQDPGCQFFTFANDLYRQTNIRYKCHLKHSWTVPRLDSQIRREPGVISGFSENVQFSPYFGPACETKLFPNIDIPGSDFQVVSAASPAHCHALCSSHPQCSYFSHESNEFRCHLKNNPNFMTLRAVNGITSGIPAHFCAPNNDWQKEAYVGIHFAGLDIRFEMMADHDTCQKSCTGDRHCQFYSYFSETHPNGDYRGRCYFKRDIVVPAPPKVTKNSNAISGFSNECHRSTSTV